MDRNKQKAKKEKPNKNLDKEKSPSFIADVKTLKENLKIREILRTVKMNSSMRIKAPRGSKVMQNKDFNDNDDIFEDTSNIEGHDLSDPPSATNPLVVNNNLDVTETSEDDCADNIEHLQTDLETSNETVEPEIETIVIQKSKSLSEGLEESGREILAPNSPVSPTDLPPLESPLLRTRDRKLSLDHTMLSKREGLSQSEVDLHSIGKLPLERKSSFFRKKMDSFLKNTTEIFKRQSLGSKSPQSVQRRGSTCSRMSMSMQSLNENEAFNGDYYSAAPDKYTDLRGSTTSLRSSVTPARSNSSLSASQSDRVLPDQSEDDSLIGSRPALDSSQPLGDMSSISNNSLSVNYNQESFLHSRAISMSSGLDTAHGPRRRKTSRSNRVTWVASESLTDYFRRLIQDEKTREMQGCHSYQDFSTIPENNLYGSPHTDSKGRRLSYQRAVSGEDPVLPTRYHDHSLRRKKISENPEGSTEVAKCLAEFSRSGVPTLVGFEIRTVPDDALRFLLWAESEPNLEQHYDWKKLPAVEEARQAVIKELIYTEADHIRHLMNIVQIYIAAAHALQDMDKLQNLNTSSLFLNIPDVLNANMWFWEQVIYPMITDSFKNNTVFNSDLMAPGFVNFAEIFEPYQDYVCHQSKAVDYLRSLSSNPEFMTYLTWCHSQHQKSRLQLADILVKPMQRLTKYSLIIRRIITYTESEESKLKLEKMESTAVAFVVQVNRAIRQKEEIEKVEDFEKVLESYDIEFKDEDLDRYFHMFNEVNLKVPMINCAPDNCRSIIYEGDLRYKDQMKECDVRAVLFTDVLLICKKLTKGGPYQYKMIRPKIFLERTSPFPRYAYRNNPLDASGLIYVVSDEHGTAVGAFVLSEPAKDPNPQQTLKIWDQKISEAKLCYDLSIWFNSNPVSELSEVEADYTSEAFKKEYPEEWNIERRARERVAAMMHPNKKVSTSHEATNIPRNSANPGRDAPTLRNPLKRNSMSGSSRNSRLSSLNQHSTSSWHSRVSSFQQSTSAASYDEIPSVLKFLYKTGSSVEHLIPPQNPDDVARSITVNVVSENECETMVPSRQTTPPTVMLLQSSPSPRSGSSQNTLRVMSPQHAVPFVHSLPDLTVEQVHQQAMPPQIQQSASEKLYKSHQELLHRNRLLAAQHHQYLSPDHRGTSYPPPSPTRGSLKRGVAFSQSFKYPPLLKMGHVHSQSQMHIDDSQASTSQTKVTESAEISQEPVASTSTDRGDKKKQLLMGNKSDAKSSPSPETKDDQSSNVDDPSKADDDGKSPKSKGEKPGAKIKSDWFNRRDKLKGG